ncbi:hypothetical protein [Tatumella citrea]|nr:hypothetical protein [Tatumella citrea]
MSDDLYDELFSGRKAIEDALAATAKQAAELETEAEDYERDQK